MFTHIMNEAEPHQHSTVEDARDCEVDYAQQEYLREHQHIYKETPDGYGCIVCLYN